MRSDTCRSDTCTTDSAGASTTNWFNNQGLRVAVSNAVGRLESNVYDVQDRATNTVDANAVSVTTAYDSLDRALTRTYPDGGIEQLRYTLGVSAQTSYTNQLAQVTLYVYDPLGRKTAETNANLEATQLTYSPASDLLTLTDGKNQLTTWNYDEYGRATNKVDAASNILFVYKYDPNNRLTNRWTPAKGATVYAYDNLGNLTSIQYPLSSNISLAYDMLNRLTNMVDAVGTTRYSYDAAGQILSEDGPWSSDSISYTFNNRLRTGFSLIAPNASAWAQSYAYDLSKRLTNIISPAGTFGYQYLPQPSTLISRLALPNGSYITNTYDGNARLLSTVLKNSTNGTLNSHTYGYNVGNQRTTLTNTFGDYRSYAYDNIGQLKTAFGKESGGTPNRLQEQFGYAYDAAGNLNWRTNNALVQAFNVNTLNELTAATNTGRLTVAGTTTSAATNVTVNTSNAVLYLDYTFASTNHAVANGNNTFTAIGKDLYGRIDTNTITVNLPATNLFAYDLNGNLRTNGTRFFDYDDENQLVTNWVAAAWKSEFLYDGQHRRRIQRDYTLLSAIGNWQLTNEVRFIYDGNLILQERDPNNLPQLTLTRGLDLSGSLQGAGGIGGLLALSENRLLAMGEPGAHTYYHADANGNVTCLINMSQQIVAKYLYDPFGNTMAQSGALADANAYRFSSKEFHVNSGMYYYGYRFYEPALQRWLNKDPIGEKGGLNLYVFVENDPVSQYDIDGQILGRRTRSSCTFWDARKGSANKCTAAYAIAAAIVCRLAGESPWEQCQRMCLQTTYTPFGETCNDKCSTARFLAKTAARYAACAALCALDTALFGKPPSPQVPAD